MATAQELVADYKAENPGPLNINLATTQDATNLIIAQAQQQFFTEAGFDDVQISQIEQAQVHPHRAAGRLPGVPVAQPRRRRPRRAVHLVALLERAARRRAGAQLRPHQGRRDRPGTRRQPRRDRPGCEEGAAPRRSTDASASSATTSGAAYTVWGLRPLTAGPRPRRLRGAVRRADLPVQRHPGRRSTSARSGSSSRHQPSVEVPAERPGPRFHQESHKQGEQRASITIEIPESRPRSDRRAAGVRADRRRLR